MGEQPEEETAKTTASSKKPLPYGSSGRSSGYVPTGQGSKLRSHGANNGVHNYSSVDQGWNSFNPIHGWSSSGGSDYKKSVKGFAYSKLAFIIVAFMGIFIVYKFVNSFIDIYEKYIFHEQSSEMADAEVQDEKYEIDNVPKLDNGDPISVEPDPIIAVELTEIVADEDTSAVEVTPKAPEPPVLKHAIEPPPHHGGDLWGSGCTPGPSSAVPTGIWYGYMRNIQGGIMNFDMVCYYGNGRETNDANIIRTIIIDGFEPPNSNRIGVEVRDGVMINYWYAP